MANIEDILNYKDRVIKKATISKKALIITWLSIPGVFVLFFLFTYLPQLIVFLIKGGVKKLITDQIYVDGKRPSAMEFVWDKMFSFIPPVLLGIACFFLGLLLFVWFCWALYMTHRHFQYGLVFTETEVIGMARKQTLRVSLKNVNNIYLERSLWGRLLGYATITVASSRGSISVKNVANAETFAKELAKVTIEDENNFLNL